MKRAISSSVVVSAILAVGAVALAQSPTGFVGLVAKPVPRSLARAASLPPGVGAIVVEVVPEERRIVIDPPDGLLELNEI